MRFRLFVQPFGCYQQRMYMEAGLDQETSIYLSFHGRNGNLVHLNGNKFNKIELVTSTLHFGLDSKKDAWQIVTFPKMNGTGFNNGFHRYELIWNENGMQFFVHGKQIGSIAITDDNGFWKRGNFSGDNIWPNDTKMAPFDEEVINDLVALKFSTFLNELFFYAVLYHHKFSSRWHSLLFR